MGRARVAAGVLALILALSPLLGQAADIVVDLGSGSVLIEHDADEARRPASLVKLMTAHVAFAALDAGEIAEDDPVTVSAHAARQPPVKLGLRAGETVPFGELLAAALVGSKNDAATAVAEAVAGSEPGFVERMNETAARLGLANSAFVNATGLPAAGQKTTARDIAILARAVLDSFPERAELLSQRSVRAKGRNVSTTNPLFGRVAGARGLKTGFTCAAGYSIAGLVEVGGRSLLAVTLGHPDKSERLAAVRGLLDAAAEVPEGGAALAPARALSATPPDIRACSGRGAEIVATDIPLPVDADLFLAGVTAPPRPLPPPVVKPSPRVAPPRAALQARPERIAPVRRRPAAAPKPRAPVLPPPSPPAPPLSGWGLFLGAFDSDAAAQTAARQVIGRAGLARTTPARTVPRERDGRRLAVIYTLRRGDTAHGCQVARASGFYCVALSPERLRNPRARWRR